MFPFTLKLLIYHFKQYGISEAPDLPLFSIPNRANDENFLVFFLDILSGPSSLLIVQKDGIHTLEARWTNSFNLHEDNDNPNLNHLEFPTHRKQLQLQTI